MGGTLHPTPPSTEVLNLGAEEIRALVSASSPTGTVPVAFAQKWALFQERLDYAWKFFDFHAKQRMSMFNFFLLFVGFVLAGYANLYKSGDYLPATILAALGALLSFCFVPLDRRNEELVHVAEDTLFWLESDVLFESYNREIVWPHRRGLFRMNKHKEKDKPLGIFRRQEREQEECKRSLCEHGNWIPIFQWLVIIVFVLLAIFPSLHKSRPAAETDKPAPVSQIISFPATAPVTASPDTPHADVKDQTTDRGQRTKAHSTKKAH